MVLPDPEGFRMHVHEVCNNAYCIKRFVPHMIPFPPSIQMKTL